MKSRSQSVAALVIGIVCMLYGGAAAWIDAVVRLNRSRPAFFMALGLFVIVGATIALVRSFRVDRDELEQRWKL